MKTDMPITKVEQFLAVKRLSMMVCEIKNWLDFIEHGSSEASTGLLKFAAKEASMSNKNQRGYATP